MKVTVRTILPDPPEAVFDFVADMHHDEDWAPMVHSVKQIEGDGPHQGARYRYLQDMGRHQVEMESTITEYDRPRRLRWVIDHKAMDYQSTMRFAPHRKGTQVTQTNVETWKRAPLGLRLVAPLLVRRQLRKQLGLLARALAKERGEEESAEPTRT